MRPPPGAGKGLAGEDARAVRGTVVGISGEMLGLAVGFLSAVFLTRTFGPELYGDLSIVYAAVTPPAWLAAGAFSGRGASLLIARSGASPAAQALVLRVCLFTGLLTLAGFAIAVPWVARSLGRTDLQALLWFAALEIALMPVSLAHRDIITGLGRYSVRGSATVLFHSVRLALVVALVMAGAGVAGVIAASLAARVAEIAYFRRFARPGLRRSAEPLVEGARRLLSTNVLNSVGMQVYIGAPIIAIGLFGASQATLGHFGAAKTLALVPGLLSGLIGMVMVAAAGRRVAQGADPWPVVEATMQIALLIAVALAPVAGAAPSVIGIVFGAAYSPSADIFPWLAASSGAMLLTGVYSGWLLVAGRTWLAQSIAPAMALAMIAALPWFWRQNGAEGAAMAQAAIGSTAAILAMIFLPRPGYLAFVSFAAKCALAAALGFLSASYLAAIAPAGADLVVGTAVAALVVFATRALRPDEVRLFVAMARAPNGGAGPSSRGGGLDG